MHKWFKVGNLVNAATVHLQLNMCVLQNWNQGMFSFNALLILVHYKHTVHWTVAIVDFQTGTSDCMTA